LSPTSVPAEASAVGLKADLQENTPKCRSGFSPTLLPAEAATALMDGPGPLAAMQGKTVQGASLRLRGFARDMDFVPDREYD
jgi:hypothetical protein